MPAAHGRRERRSPALLIAVLVLAVVLLAGLGWWWRTGLQHDADAKRAMAAQSSSPQKMSTKCKFTAGDRAGQLVDFSPSPALPVGSDCNDGTSSSGVVVE